MSNQLGGQRPIDVVLYCPRCLTQHIDAPETDTEYSDRLHESSWWELGGDKPERWTNPPHKSHLCHHCKWIWRPADVPTNGIAAPKTKGKDDSTGTMFALTESNCYAQEALWQLVPEVKPRDDDVVVLTPGQLEALLRKMGWVPPNEWRILRNNALRSMEKQKALIAESSKPIERRVLFGDEPIDDQSFMRLPETKTEELKRTTVVSKLFISCSKCMTPETCSNKGCLHKG